MNELRPAGIARPRNSLSINELQRLFDLTCFCVLLEFLVLLEFCVLVRVCGLVRFCVFVRLTEQKNPHPFGYGPNASFYFLLRILTSDLIGFASASAWAWRVDSSFIFLSTKLDFSFHERSFLPIAHWHESAMADIFAVSFKSLSVFFMI